MSARALVGHHLRRHRGALLAVCGGMFVFEWLITRIAPEPAQAGAIQGMLQFLPAEFVNILGSEFTANFSARGIIGFGWVHPFCLLMMAFWSVRLTAGALAGEIGMGTMDLLAARPVRRSAMVLEAFLVLIAGLAAVVLSGFAGTAIGLATRPSLGIPATAYLPVAGGCWLLFAAFGSVGLLMSAIRRQGGGAIALTSGIMAASLALDYLGRTWRPITGLRPLSLFMYYAPQQILAGSWGVSSPLRLAVVAVVAVTAAIVLFGRRDL